MTFTVWEPLSSIVELSSKSSIRYYKSSVLGHFTELTLSLFELYKNSMWQERCSR